MWKIRGEADSRAEPRDTGAAVMSSRLKMLSGEADSRAEPRDTGAAVMSSRLKMLSGLERSDKNKRKAPVFRQGLWSGAS
jgi:hypothetical protein